MPGGFLLKHRLSLETPFAGLSWTGVRFSAPPPIQEDDELSSHGDSSSFYIYNVSKHLTQESGEPMAYESRARRSTSAIAGTSPASTRMTRRFLVRLIKRASIRRFWRHTGARYPPRPKTCSPTCARATRVGVELGKLVNYAQRKLDEDTRNATYQDYSAQVISVYTDVSSATSWFARRS